MSAKVGIFIPAYNAAKFLDKSIQSVLNQTYQDFTLLVLDDASEDETPEVVKKHLDNPRIKYIRNEKNLGMAGNWNKGIELLENEYVAKLDADDFYEHKFLEHVVQVLDQNPAVGMVFTGLNWIIQNNNTTNQMLPYTRDWVVDGKTFRANLVRKCVAYGPTIVARKECYNRLGAFLPEMRIHNDWEMWMRIASNYDVAFVSKVLSNALRHPENLTTASRSDTRMPDDFSAWLRKLDDGSLPYQLLAMERASLEAAMIVMVRGLFMSSVNRGNILTAKACVKFLNARYLVPFYEKIRYNIALGLIKQFPDLAKFALRGRGITEKGWQLEPYLLLKIPANDPFAALAIQ
jgi:glycosyltransferase involved in cell wall biosynthesis